MKSTARLTSNSILATLIAAAFLAISGCSIAAPETSSAEADLVWYFDVQIRDTVDIAGDGHSHGDITIANGIISETAGGEAIGTYALVGVYAMVNMPGVGGITDRSINQAMRVGESSIFSTSLVSTTAGVRPMDSFKQAITGGTGVYSGVRGEILVEPLSDSRLRYSFYFVD